MTDHQESSRGLSISESRNKLNGCEIEAVFIQVNPTECVGFVDGLCAENRCHAGYCAIR